MGELGVYWPYQIFQFLQRKEANAVRTYVLDPASPTPLYEQLYRCIKEDLLSGAIAGGEKLPSKRALAENLNVSRITVESAYQQLLTEGYLRSRPRSGYYAEVLETLPQPSAPRCPAAAPVSEAPPPSAGQFPFSVWARLMRGVLLDCRERLLAPMPGQGLPELRAAIAGMLRRSRGMAVDPEAIVIGAGAEYLYNVLLQLLGRDKVFALENPGHRKLRQVYAAGGAQVRPVEMDESGVTVSGLIASGAGVLHISPGHQFPTGAVMPIARRRQLMAWLGSSRGRYLIEDDYDSEFRFTGKVIPTMYSMDVTGRVIYLNTFSKTITPALRISYLILPPELLDRYREKLGFYSCTVPSFEQLTLARFLDEGYFEKHVSRMKRHYRLLRQRFRTELEQRQFGRRVEVLEDEAGLHMLLRLKTVLPDADLTARFQASGIPAAALAQYYFPDTAPKTPGAVVLQYADLPETEIPAVLDLLAEIVKGEG